MSIVLASLIAIAPAVPPPPSAINTAPSHARNTEPLRRRRTRQRNTYRVFAGSFLLTGIGLHGAGLVRMYVSDAGPGALGLMLSGTSFNAAGLVMTGLASRANGQLAALDDAAGPRWKRRKALGWSLLGVGLGVYAASRVAPAGCFTTECAAGITIGGYTAGLAMTLVGAHVVGYAHGYGKHGRSIRISPDATTGSGSSKFGLNLAGRF